MTPHRSIEGLDMTRAHEHVNIAARVATRSERPIDGRSLDMQQVDTDRVGKMLDGGMPEPQAHHKRHIHLGSVHACCTTSSITLAMA